MSQQQQTQDLSHPSYAMDPQQQQQQQQQQHYEQEQEQPHQRQQHPYALPYAQHPHEHSQQRAHDPATASPYHPAVLHHPHMPGVPTSLAQSNQAEFLHSFWTEQMAIAERFESDFKVHPLPLARIKKVMKSDADVKQMISAEAPMLFSKACEIFITELTLRAWMHAEENKRRTLQRSDVASAVGKSDQFDFLIDIVPREEQGKAKRHKEDEIAYDHASYYYSATGQPYPAHGDASAYYHQMQQIQQYHQYAQQHQQGGGGYPSQPDRERASQFDGERASQYEGERSSQYEGERASQYDGERASQYNGERPQQS